MTRLTIDLPDELAQRVADAAARRGLEPEELAAEVLVAQFPARRKLGFVSLGRSTDGAPATEDENMLADGFGR